MRPIPILLAILLALGAVEGVAYWWMHPKPAGLGEPVLTYRPVGRDPARSAHLSPAARDEKDQETGVRGQGTEDRGQQDAAASSSATSSNQQSAIDNQQSSIAPSSSASLRDLSGLAVPSSLTPLPEIVAAALPSLRCTTGTAARIDREDDVTIHVAFFEWDLSSSTNVLEAFKHLPEQCMGSIGLTLIEKAPPRSYVVRGQGTEDRLSVVGGPLSDEESVGSESPPHASLSPSAADNRQPTTDNVSSYTLSFDHTIFRDQGGVIIHAFKGTWVSGASTLLGGDLRGGIEQWNQLRWKAALKRFRPAHARVAQGAVRGIRDPDLAWQAFEESMLKGLMFASQ